MSVSIRRNVLSNWFALGFRMVVGFFILPWVIRMVGKDGYGQYQLLIALFGYSTVLDMGFRAAVLRYVAQLSAAREIDRLNRILGSIFAYYAIVGLVVVVASALVYALHRPWMLPDGAEPRFPFYVLLFGVATAINFFRITWQSVVWARERYDISNLIEIVTFVLRSILLIVFLLRGHGVIVVVAADIFEFLTSLIIHRIVAMHHFPEIRPRWRGARGEDLKAVTGYSFWAFLNTVSIQLRFRSPSLVIGWTLNAAAVTVFGLASRAQMYLFQVHTAMSSPYRARMSAQLGKDDMPALRELTIQGTRWMSLLSFSLCGALWVHADRFMYAWMGPEYGESGVVLRILLPGLALHMSQLVLVNALFAVGRHQWLSIITGLEAAVLATCGFALVGDHGLAGIAWGVTVPVALNKVTLQPIYACRSLGVRISDLFWRGFFRPGLVALLCVPLVYGFEQIWTARSLAGILVQLALSVVPFALAGWWIVFDAQDRVRLAEMARRAFRRPVRSVPDATR